MGFLVDMGEVGRTSDSLVEDSHHHLEEVLDLRVVQVGGAD